MTTPHGTQQPDTALTRDLLYAARYYLGRPRTLLIVATIAIVAGLVLNWNWLVAVGLAPILLSTLPCLIMCAFGVCMMCRSAKEQSASLRDTTPASTPPAVLTGSAIDRASTETNAPAPLSAAAEPTAVATPELTEINEPLAGFPSCCRGTSEFGPAQTINLQPSEERKMPNA
jgi:hypothetical protein